jgi:hypothetical protein
MDKRNFTSEILDVLFKWKKATRKDKDDVMRFFMPEDDIEKLRFRVYWCSPAFPTKWCDITVFHVEDTHDYRICEIEVTVFGTVTYDWDMANH